MGPPPKRLASYRIGFAHREDLDFNLSLEGTRRENTRGGGHPEYGGQLRFRHPPAWIWRTMVAFQGMSSFSCGMTLPPFVSRTGNSGQLDDRQFTRSEGPGDGQGTPGARRPLDEIDMLCLGHGSYLESVNGTDDHSGSQNPNPRGMGHGHSPCSRTTTLTRGGSALAARGPFIGNIHYIRT